MEMSRIKDGSAKLEDWWLYAVKLARCCPNVVQVVKNKPLMYLRGCFW